MRATQPTTSGHLGAGFDYHLVKPVNPDALHGLVARLGKSTPEDSSTLQ